MEQDGAVETVYYVEKPYAANEEEIATSYISVENEEGIGTAEVIEHAKIIEDDVESENNTLAKRDDCNSNFEDHITSDENSVPEKDKNEVEGMELTEASEATASDDTSDLSCGICSKTFAKFWIKLRHIRTVHNKERQNDTCIKCIECDINFRLVSNLRSHLAEKHKLEMTEEYLTFPNMEAFKKWKCEIERQTVGYYALKHGTKEGPRSGRYIYACHRSGKYVPRLRGPRQRRLKTQGSCKMGITCTAAMTVQVNHNDVSIKFCPFHYGHGKETTLIQLTNEEQTAIAESVSKGIPYEKLLDEIRDSQSSKDHFQLYLLKKKDIRSINNAYNCDDFNTGMSDAESVDHWVNSCSQMENSPILYYRKEEYLNEKSNQEKFLLIIMTEFQKHILLSANKQVICVDSLYRKKAGRFYLTVLFIMDENELAFPVAFCISNKVEKNVISLFFKNIFDATGPLECEFFMSDSEPFYYEAWKEVMNDNSKWLWSIWIVDGRFRTQLNVFRGNLSKRADAYKTMRMLLECQNQTVFKIMLENFIESLQNDPDSKNLGDFVKNHYGLNAEIWAYCYRKEIDLATNIHLEIMHRTFCYCCREGRKKRLDKFIFVIMKLVRDKMLDRLTSMVDEERIELALETINACHNLGLEIHPEQITALSEKTWLIQSENDEENYYVTRENTTCPEHCNLKCKDCDICVHMYICSCIHNLIKANLCQHMHAVVWHLLTPHFTPPPSPVPLLCDFPEKKDESFEFYQKLLKQSHEVYKQIQANKCTLDKVSLNSLMKRLNECIEICYGKILDEEEPPLVVAASPQPQTQPQPEIAPMNPPPGTVLLINSLPMNNQPLLLPNPVANVVNPNFPQGMGGYVLLLPNNANQNVNSVPKE